MTTLSQIYTSLDSGVSWNSANGQAVSLTYSFNGPWGSGTGIYGETVRQMSAADQAQVRQILQSYSDVANITFTETFSGDGDIAFRNGDLGNTGIAGYAYLPGGGIGGNVTIESPSTLGTLSFGNVPYYVTVHEIGHALGLDHPFAEPNPSAPKAGGIPANELTTLYSAMAYNGIEQLSTPQIYDIATLQFLYGANNSHNTGDNFYGYNNNATSPVLSTIWDAGGTDIISAFSQQQSVSIDLREGNFLSQIGSDYVKIAFNTVIENARGGYAADSIQGNAANNTIFGGRGADTLRGADGQDVLVGGINTADSADVGDMLYGGLGNDFIYGNAGDDIITGGRTTTDALDGNDTINGGLGNDTIYGNAGNDVLIGSAGNDKIYGGLGDDIIRITPNNAGDTIYGFQGAGQAGGDVIQLFANMNGTAIDSYADLMANAVTDGVHTYMPTGGGNGVLLLFHTPDDLIASDFSFI